MSPKTKEQVEIIRKQSIESIQEAALGLFAEKGYHATSISQIAKRANVSKGLLYNYFDSKQELLYSIVLSFFEGIEGMMKGYFLKEGSPSERFKVMIDQTFAMVNSGFSHWRLLTSLTFQPEVLEGLGEELTRFQEWGVQAFADMLKELKVPNYQLESRYLAAAIDGIFMHYMTEGDIYPLEKMKDFIIEKYCNQ